MILPLNDRMRSSASPGCADLTLGRLTEFFVSRSAERRFRTLHADCAMTADFGEIGLPFSD